MTVRPGYKQTEIGIIPDDWDAPELYQLGEFKNGINKDGSAFGHGTPILSLSDVFGANRIATSARFSLVACSNTEQSVYNLKAGDVAFVRSSVKPSGVGLAALIENDLGNAVYSGFLIRFRTSERIGNSFKAHCFAEQGFRCRVIAASSVSANTNINQQNLAKIPIPLPRTTAEQEAIAEALSDADALIESLEQLIAKKRQIKQGAMQQLLTGRKRLPGFVGKWTEKSLNEVIECLDNLRMPINDSVRSNMSGPFPYCGANGVLDYIDDYCVDDDVILMAEDGGHFDEYLTRPIAYRMSGQIWVNNHAHILKSKPKYDQEFLYYSLVHKNITNFIASGTRAKLNKSEMLKITVLQPDDREEQTAIAKILSDMDAEITGLETKLAKARQVKQGMMQQLLTGHIRLVKPQSQPIAQADAEAI